MIANHGRKISFCIPIEVSEMYPDTNKPRSNAHTTKLK